MQDYFLHGKKLADALAASGTPVSGAVLQQHLLGGLDSAYDPIVATLTATFTDIPMADFQAHLMAFEMRLEAQSSLMQNTTAVNVAARQNQSPPQQNRPPQSQYRRRSSGRSNRGGYTRGPFVHPQGPCQLCASVCSTCSAVFYSSTTIYFNTTVCSSPIICSYS
ncbi:hypothetical protein BVC80_8881g26 [Macleaya cordata]|uniref:Uncharacterized protein n=1 Tax=Macleaya cordata TaxID=56857 RepID=A0A200Q7C8_MACCD|nr:hypothetical protein BVC80_8881g26 [Macleaya cordata]